METIRYPYVPPWVVSEAKIFTSWILITFLGTAEGDFERLCDILENVPDVKFICLDVANGYSQFFVEYVAKVRKAFPTHTILAGNVVTGDMVEALIFAGADIVKVGIGPGSVCTTRKKTGVGYPQLSAVLECADNAHGLSAHIISVILFASNQN